MGILQVEAVLATPVGEAVDLEELVGEDVVQKDVAEAVAALGEGFLLGEGGEAQGDQELQGRDLGLVLLGGVEGHGGKDPMWAFTGQSFEAFGARFAPTTLVGSHDRTSWRFRPCPKSYRPARCRLPDLGICASRRIGDLTIPWLGRVTPFARRNGVGKTTVLDALPLYVVKCHGAARRGPRALLQR